MMHYSTPFITRLTIVPLWTPPELNNFTQRVDWMAFPSLNSRYNDSVAWDLIYSTYYSYLLLTDDDVTARTIRMILDFSFAYFHSNHRSIRLKFSYFHDDISLFQKELPMLKRKYPEERNFWMEAFYYHHGLRFASEEIHRYVKARDIIDAGAYLGDSLTVLSNYTIKAICSYEVSPKLFKISQERGFKYNSTKHQVYNSGLSNQKGFGFLSLKDTHISWNSVTQTPNQNFKFELTTIDDEMKRLNLTVGFIKADIEGAEMAMLHGAMETIKRDHPVLSIAIYHSDDLVFIPKFIESIGGYQIHFRTETAHDSWMRTLYELRILAIPNQLSMRNKKPWIKNSLIF